jgi:hypothetical protein
LSGVPCKKKKKKKMKLYNKFTKNFYRNIIFRRKREILKKKKRNF